MNKILTKVNLAIRSSVLADAAESCSGYLRNGFLHISVESAGCKFRNAGCCTMCDYGCGKPASAADVAYYMENIWNEKTEPVSEFLVGSCGSIFDANEISNEVLDAVLWFLVNHQVLSVIFETHYSTVTADILTQVKNALASDISCVSIEMGLESADPYVLNNSINKYLDLSALRNTIMLIKSFDMGVILNVFLGAPFLTPALQLADAERAIKWACDNGADSVVIFPANIKPRTLVGYLYDKGRYERQYAWFLVELLNRIPNDIIDKTELSWYGDRQKMGIAKNTLPPYACEICEGLLQEFFAAYNAVRCDASAKRKLVDEVLDKSNLCGCYAAMKDSLDRPGENAEVVVARELKLLAQEFKLEGI